MYAVVPDGSHRGNTAPFKPKTNTVRPKWAQCSHCGVWLPRCSRPWRSYRGTDTRKRSRRALHIAQLLGCAPQQILVPDASTMSSCVYHPFVLCVLFEQAHAVASDIDTQLCLIFLLTLVATQSYPSSVGQAYCISAYRDHHAPPSLQRRATCIERGWYGWLGS
jgi:hypothetical protein